MQEQESNDQTHVVETVSYIAWEPSAGTINGLTFEVNTTGDVSTDTTTLRWRNKDPIGVEIKVEEEKSRDSETVHTTEVVGYITFAFE